MKISRLFGRKTKKEKTDTTQEALQKLNDGEELLLKKQAYLEQKVNAELQIAKKHGTSNKRVALQALRRKKQYEKQLEQLDGSLNTIQHQKAAIENLTVNVEVMRTLSATSKTMKNACGGLNADEVHDLLDDIVEQQDMADEISRAISNPMGTFDSEADLLAELEQLENEDLDAKLLKVDSSFKSVGNSKIEPHARSSESVNVDRELAQLASWGLS